jgi:hypothetical protein
VAIETDLRVGTLHRCTSQLLLSSRVLLTSFKYLADVHSLFRVIDIAPPLALLDLTGPLQVMFHSRVANNSAEPIPYCKRKFVPVLNYALRYEGVEGSGCINPRFLNLDISWRWVVTFSLRPLNSGKVFPGTFWANNSAEPIPYCKGNFVSVLN